MHQRFLWNLDDIKDMNLDELPSTSPKNNNFEDYLGSYAKIVMRMSRVSSDIELKKACKEKCKHLWPLMLSLHGDHNMGNYKDSGTVILKCQDLKETCNMFCKRNVNANG